MGPPDIGLPDKNTTVDHIHRYEGLLNTLNATLNSMYPGNSVFYPSLLHSNNVQPFISMFRRALTNKNDRSVTFGFTGTSVTAGHDSYYNQSYPFVFERLFRNFTELFNLTLVVRNVAMGNNPIMPYGACINSHLGENVDFVFWEQMMMCPGDEEPYCVDAFLQHIQKMNRKPPVMVLSNPDPSQSSAAVQARIGRFNGADSMYSNYEYYGFGTISPTEGVLRGVGSWTTMEYLEEDGKPWEKGRHWHPGPYGHEFMAYILVKEYSEFLYQAVLQELSHAPAGEVPGFVNPARNTKSKYGEFFQTQQCLTLFEPKYREQDDLALVVISNFTDSRPDLEVQQYVPQFWNLELWPQDISAVGKARTRGAGYADLKWSLLGGSENGPLHFQFKASTNGTVILCNAPPEWGNYPSDMGSLGSTNVVFYVNDVISQSQKIGRDNDPCWKLQEPVAEGNNVLRLEITGTLKIGISQLLIP